MSDKKTILTLEHLPNEILTECFQYLDAFDMFYAFDQLNHRFKSLTRTARFYVNLEDVSKSKFDQFCGHLLLDPEIKHNIHSLILPNDLDCFQIKKFFSYFSLNEFCQLEKLDMMKLFINISSDKMWNILTSTSKVSANDVTFSKLKTLSIANLDSSIMNIFIASPIINLTVSECAPNQMYDLLQYSSLLKYLHIENLVYSHRVNDTYYSIYNYTYINDQRASNLKQIIIDHVHISLKAVGSFLKHITNLRSLTLCADISYNRELTDALRWEDLITSSLIHLTDFEFKFSYPASRCIFYADSFTMYNMYERFQNDFWHKQHQWYTEYTENDTGEYIYSIPYPSNTYRIAPNHSRYGNKFINHMDAFTHVTDLIVDNQIFMKNYEYYFSNVKSLTLKSLEFTTKYVQCLKMMINTYYLKHIDLSNIDGIEQSSTLLRIFRDAPQLSSLDVNFIHLIEHLDDKELCQYLNKRIKRLNLYFPNDITLKFYSIRTKFCEIFSNIEYLQCEIGDEDDLLFLLEHLSKLTVLNVTFSSDFHPDDILDRFKQKANELDMTYDMEHEWVSDLDHYRDDYDYGSYEINIWIWIR